MYALLRPFYLIFLFHFVSFIYFNFFFFSMLMVHPDNTYYVINYLCVCNPLTGFSSVIDLGKDFFFVHVMI